MVPHSVCCTYIFHTIITSSTGNVRGVSITSENQLRKHIQEPYYTHRAQLLSAALSDDEYAVGQSLTYLQPHLCARASFPKIFGCLGLVFRILRKNFLFPDPRTICKSLWSFFLKQFVEVMRTLPPALGSYIFLFAVCCEQICSQAKTCPRRVSETALLFPALPRSGSCSTVSPVRQLVEEKRPTPNGLLVRLRGLFGRKR